MNFAKNARRTAHCFSLTLVLSLGCSEPDVPSDTTDDTAGTDPTDGTTEAATEGAPTTGTGTETEGAGPLPCEGEPAAIDAEILAYTSAVGDNDLAIRFGSEAITCDEPDKEALASCNHWLMRIYIPPDLQAPGTYSLWDDLTADGWTNDDPCDAVEGGGVKGTLEITAIDDKEIRGRVCHLDWTPMGGESNFSFVAPRCP